jgi:hypothetical protein
MSDENTIATQLDQSKGDAAQSVQKDIESAFVERVRNRANLPAEYDTEILDSTVARYTRDAEFASAWDSQDEAALAKQEELLAREYAARVQRTRGAALPRAPLPSENKTIVDFAKMSDSDFRALQKRSVGRVSTGQVAPGAQSLEIRAGLCRIIEVED